MFKIQLPKRFYLFMLLSVCFVFSKAQTTEQLSAIDEDYNKFKLEITRVMSSAPTDDITSKRYLADFPKSLTDNQQGDYSVGISDPFSPPLHATHQALRRACFIQALKSNCKAFAIFDYYSRYSPASRGEKSMGLKEMAHVFVDSLYDLRQAKIINHEYLRTGELVLTVDFSNCKRTGSSALFEVQKSRKEKGKGVHETSVIKIIDRRDKNDYEIKKDYQNSEITSRDVSKNDNFGNFRFSYSFHNTKFGLKGGLWSYIVQNLSSTILNQASDKTTNVKSVKDYHINNMVVDLTRTSGFFPFTFAYKTFIQGLRRF